MQNEPEQLELFPDAPFSLRLPIEDAIALFRRTYWDFLPKARTTGKCFERLHDFFRLRGIRYVDEVSKITVEDLRRHLSGLGLKQNTINTHHALVTRLFSVLYERRELGSWEGIDMRRIPLPKKNPGSQVRKVNEKQFERRVAWPKKTVYRIVQSALDLNDLLLAEITEMLYLTRLRPGDLWDMTDLNVDLSHMVIHGIQHKTITRRLPSGVPYLLAITPHMAAILRRRMEITPSGQHLFRDNSVSLVAWLGQVQKRFNLVRARAGLKRVQLRDFRPSSATLLADNLVDLQTVQESLGHTSPRNLPVYTRRTVGHQRRAQEILENKDTEILI